MINKSKDKGAKLEFSDIDCAYIMLCRGTETYNKKAILKMPDVEISEKVTGFDS
jgi:hypothetical protein